MNFRPRKSTFSIFGFFDILTMTRWIFRNFFQESDSPYRFTYPFSEWVEKRPISMRKSTFIYKIIFRFNFFDILGQFLKIHIFSIKSPETVYIGVFWHADSEFDDILTIRISDTEIRYRNSLFIYNLII